MGPGRPLGRAPRPPRCRDRDGSRCEVRRTAQPARGDHGARVESAPRGCAASTTPTPAPPPLLPAAAPQGGRVRKPGHGARDGAAVSGERPLSGITGPPRGPPLASCARELRESALPLCRSARPRGGRQRVICIDLPRLPRPLGARGRAVVRASLSPPAERGGPPAGAAAARSRLAAGRRSDAAAGAGVSTAITQAHQHANTRNRAPPCRSPAATWTCAR
jgi:hypothetical protein